MTAHGARLDAIVLGWIALDTLTGAPFAQYPDSSPRVWSPGKRRMAVVTSFVGGAFHPGVIRRLALDSAALRRSAEGVAAWARRDGYRGLVLHFEGMTAPDSDATRLQVALRLLGNRVRPDDRRVELLT